MSLKSDQLELGFSIYQILDQILCQQNEIFSSKGDLKFEDILVQR